MPEIIDVYNSAREKIGKIERGTPMPDGGNKISVHVWIKNKKGEYLLQQRVSNAKKFPNMWGQTGGGAQSGESSWQCCVRECREELGLNPDIKSAIWVGTFKRPLDFVDVWLIEQDVNLADIRMQPEEVQNVKWASLDEIQRMIENKNFIPSILPGFEMIDNYFKMLRTFPKA